MGQNADPKLSEGARLERRATRAHLRSVLRQLETGVALSPQAVVRGILDWTLNRAKRYDKAPGGLGKLAILFAVGLTLASCGGRSRPAPQPATPPHWDLDIQTTVGGAALRIVDGPNTGAQGTTDAKGRRLLSGLAQSGFTLCASAKGYEDACAGITLTASQNVTLTLKAVKPPRPQQMRGRLRAQGRVMVYPDGARFRFRGLMAFGLLDLLADGHDADARAYLAWARDTGFNVVRVLAMLPSAWLDLSAADGRAALPRLFALAREHDVYVQIVALANTATVPTLDYGAHVEAIGRACAGEDACALVEVANEPFHPTQAAAVHDPANLRIWAARIPGGVPVALGAAAEDESPVMGQGASVVVSHLSRSRDRWNRVRRVRELEALSSGTGHYVIDNEPMGAAEAAENGRRDNDPATFFAQGALSRVFEVGSTFHCTDCLLAHVPGPVQRASATAFVEGTRLWPDAAVLHFSNAGWGDSPVKAADFKAVVRAYSASDQAGQWWTVLLGLTGDPKVEWRDGYRVGAVVVDRGAVKVLRVVR